VALLFERSGSATSLGGGVQPMGTERAWLLAPVGPSRTHSLLVRASSAVITRPWCCGGSSCRLLVLVALWTYQWREERVNGLEYDQRGAVSLRHERSDVATPCVYWQRFRIKYGGKNYFPLSVSTANAGRSYWTQRFNTVNIKARYWTQRFKPLIFTRYWTQRFNH
jgi:hypothetical protein